MNARIDKYINIIIHIDCAYPLVAEKAAELSKDCNSDKTIAKRYCEYVPFIKEVKMERFHYYYSIFPISP